MLRRTSRRGLKTINGCEQVQQTCVYGTGILLASPLTAGHSSRHVRGEGPDRIGICNPVNTFFPEGHWCGKVCLQVHYLNAVSFAHRGARQQPLSCYDPEFGWSDVAAFSSVRAAALRHDEENYPTTMSPADKGFQSPALNLHT